MLKIKFFANFPLMLPEMEVSGENTLEIAEKYLQQSPVLADYKTIHGRMLRTIKKMELPTWGVINNKRMQSSAYLCDAFVRNGYAVWVEFSPEEFDPRNAVSRIRKKNFRYERTQAIRTRQSESAKKVFEENRDFRIKKMQEGRKRKRMEQELTPEETTRQRRIARGALPRSADEIPDWFQAPEEYLQ